MATLEAEGELAPGVEVEANAAGAQLRDRRRRLLDEGLDGARSAEAASGGEGVGRVLSRRVARLQRRREPALGPVAGALRERRARDETDPAAVLGRPKGGPETRGAAADDDDVELCGGLYRRSASRRIESI
jgi:hypothetical protein